jgi:hypothetical protein
MADGLYGAIYVRYTKISHSKFLSIKLNCSRENFRPRKNAPNPFHMISQDVDDLASMQRAEQDPRLVVLSDWEHLTSEEYFNLQNESGLDLL